VISRDFGRSNRISGRTSCGRVRRERVPATSPLTISSDSRMLALRLHMVRGGVHNAGKIHGRADSMADFRGHAVGCWLVAAAFVQKEAA
jgi:hypothetical protein